MDIEKFLAPTYEELRPFREGQADPGFPVYPDLVERFLAAHARPGEAPPRPDREVAHALAVCAGYGYAGGGTVATMMARLGLKAASCITFSEVVDAMLICTTAHLVQSRCGRLAILCYRGTEPLNLISWLTDADVHPEKVVLRPGQRPVTIHAGFHRNVRATRFEVARALRAALLGLSLYDGHRLSHPLEALYLTGHSQGGALAALFALMAETSSAYRPLADKLRAVYTFGQPMIACPPLPGLCDPDGELGRKTFRFIYEKDVVPALPPTASGRFQHFGHEHRLRRTGAHPAGDLPQNGRATRQVGSLIELPLAASAFFGDQMKWFRHLSFCYSLDDHFPHHYIQALQPADRASEFGD